MDTAAERQELYSLANPQVVLWPTAETDLDSYKAAPDTAWLVANENTKEFVVSWFGTRVLKLPYTPAQNAETKFPGDPTAGNALVEPEEPDTAVTLPEPYFDPWLCQRTARGSKGPCYRQGYRAAEPAM